MSKTRLFNVDRAAVMEEIGPKNLKGVLARMLLIRHFEIRAESAYQHGKIGGFFHAYMGQEAIALGAVDAIGVEKNWWTTTYRCHGLAFALGVTPKEAMAELYGKVTGNALGRGGSMHLYSERMLGGFGIVGGHLPIIAGAAFSLKYQKQKGVSVGFLGEGAVVQGAFHEAMNLMSLWQLPAIVVIENNLWGMGTAVSRAVCVEPIAEHFAPAYGLKAYTFDGMDYLTTYGTFQAMQKEVLKTGKPVLAEAITERFRGHSISDPGLYRTKEELAKAKNRDPIHILKQELEKKFALAEGEYEALSEAMKEEVLQAIIYAEESPLPDEGTLEEGVFSN